MMDEPGGCTIDYRALSSQRLNADLYGSRSPVVLREIYPVTESDLSLVEYNEDCQIVNANIRNEKFDCDVVSRPVNDYPPADFFVLSEANYMKEKERCDTSTKMLGVGMNSFHKIETNGVIILARLTDEIKSEINRAANDFKNLHINKTTWYLSCRL